MTDPQRDAAAVRRAIRRRVLARAPGRARPRLAELHRDEFSRLYVEEKAHAYAELSDEDRRTLGL